MTKQYNLPGYQAGNNVNNSKETRTFADRVRDHKKALALNAAGLALVGTGAVVAHSSSEMHELATGNPAGGAHELNVHPGSWVDVPVHQAADLVAEQIENLEDRLSGK